MGESNNKRASGNSESLEELDDNVLARMCQEELPHKLDAYQELLRRHESLVFNTCLKMTRSYEDAQEVCQDAFLQVFHKVKQFEGRAAFKTWLFRIVYNLCIRRRETISKRAFKENAAGNEVAADIHAKELATPHDSELSEGVHEALNRLDENQRQILILKYITGLSLQEISEVLEIKLSATKMRLYRALDKFKDTYNNLNKPR